MMKTELELITLIRNWVQAMNQTTNATFVFTHGLSDPELDNAIESIDGAGYERAYGEITHIVRGEEESQFEICVVQDRFGVGVTAYLWLEEPLLIPADAGSIHLLLDCLVLNTMPIFADEDADQEVELVAVMGFTAYCASEPMILFRMLRNLAGSVSEIDARFSDDAEDWGRE
jgi:hypothetical protein